MQTLPHIQKLGARQVSAATLRETEYWNRQQRLISGEGVTLSRTANGIVVRANPKIQDHRVSRIELNPFMIRWFSHAQDPIQDNGSIGEWQIYLPLGCILHNGGKVIVDNTKATDADGNEIVDWYKIDYKEEGEYSVYTIGTNRKCVLYPVYLILAPMPVTKVVMGDADSSKILFSRSIVGWIGERIENDKTYHHVYQPSYYIATPKHTRSIDTQKFAIAYKKKESEKKESGKDNESEKLTMESYEAVITNQSLIAGRVELRIVEDTKIKDDWKEIAVRIIHEKETFELKVEDVQGEDPSKVNAENETRIVIYKINETGDVISDSRGNLNSLPFFN